MRQGQLMLRMTVAFQDNRDMAQTVITAMDAHPCFHQLRLPELCGQEQQARAFVCVGS